MNENHLSIPVKPSFDIIEAMVEASIANQGNVEKIYAAVIQYHAENNREICADASENQITRAEIAAAWHPISRLAGVVLRVNFGPQSDSAEVFMPAESARSLASDLIYRAGVAEQGR